jgi:O-antigen/teichoic acid export membrane protein
MVFYQPAIMIVKGKNLFKEDLLISILTSIIFVILLVFFINNYSIKGVGYSLLITELFSCLFFFYFANNWLKKKFVTFRNKIIVVPITDLTITIILIFSYLIFNNSSEHIIIIYIITKLIVILIFWNVLSKIIKKKIIKSFDLIINFKNKL